MAGRSGAGGLNWYPADNIFNTEILMRLTLNSITWLIAFGCIVSGGKPAEAANSARAQLGALIDEAWEFALREDPLFATNTGDHRYDDQLPRVSLADAKRRDVARRGFLARLEAIDRDALSP